MKKVEFILGLSIGFTSTAIWYFVQAGIVGFLLNLLVALALVVGFVLVVLLAFKKGTKRAKHTHVVSFGEIHKPTQTNGILLRSAGSSKIHRY